VENIVPGALYLVSTPIGNLADITYRAVHILQSVDLIAAEDTRTSSILLKHYDIQKKMISFHSYNQQKQIPFLVKSLREHKSIALITDAGTPGISDPAFVLVRAALENQVRIIPIPGASALLASVVVSGLPVNRFVFEGFLPIKKGRKTRIDSLAVEQRTIVFFESPHRILKTVRQLLEAWGDRNCVMGREMTKKFEDFFRGSLSDLLRQLEDKSAKGEIVLIIEGADKSSSLP
jgi:16S rRNA (cytidine1402-2'-O)-methyltransferase